MINIIQNTIGALGRRLGIVTKNLQMWLNFNKSEWVGGELVVKDKSPNTNNAKLFTGKALSFNGNDYVDTDVNQVISNEFTIAAWFNIDNTSQNGCIYGGGSGYKNSCRINGTTVNLRINQASSNSYNFIFPSISTTNWNRLVITRDSSNDIRCYINNVESTTGEINDSQNTELKDIGRVYNVLNYFLGSISDFQLYDTTWDSDDITFDYNNPNKLVTDSVNTGTSLVVADLKGYWALSEGAGSVAYDSSGQGNDGTIIGATYVDKQDTIPQLGMMDWAKSTPVADEITLIQAPNNIGYDILGNALRSRQNAFNLDGSGYAEVADDNSLDITTEITLSAWVKMNSGYGVLFFKDAWVANGYGLYLNTVTFGARLYINGSYHSSSSTTPLPIGVWTHVTATYDGVNIKYYLNGLADGVFAVSAGSVGVNTKDMYIGSNSGAGEGVDGLIDETLIYDRALTSTEITNNYNVGLTAHS